MLDCAVLVLKLCLFDPGNLYLEADTTWQVGGNYASWSDDGMVDLTDTGRSRITLGLFMPVGRQLAFNLECSHFSYIQLDDRGEERCGVGFAWRPFK